MSSHIRIVTSPGTWAVRAGGAVLGETKSALELTEGDYPPVIYFPRADLAMAFLEPTDHSTVCPHKGEASYFSIVTKSQTLKNAAWSYEDPAEGVEEIRDHIAFYPGDYVAIEQL
ncbi:DUF427 domain-containing protein [Pseudaestuariivita atlantica]|uniref:DUF427 domain-containing protein n=1 Tax=Pseudaestuariivita atlantica TaxID=1317121 RepID=A0A0L1JL98_9RHOB|nr:DUF427 domain-containing protein [Pseudaestuariivita atlantica]KNG92524.1 hypothetical protein ATO11_15935 [Pseudaestuariivita atlantica]